jgi:hypothetical protein
MSKEKSLLLMRIEPQSRSLLANRLFSSLVRKLTRHSIELECWLYRNKGVFLRNPLFRLQCYNPEDYNIHFHATKTLDHMDVSSFASCGLVDRSFTVWSH